MIEMSVRSNLPEFSRELQEMERKVRIKSVRRSVNAAAKVLRRAVKESAPVRTGTLARAIYSKRSRRSKDGVEIVFVSVRSGATYGKNRKTGANRDAFYWGWLETGHLARGPGERIKGGAATKRLLRQRARDSGGRWVPARPFLAPGFARGGGQALAEFVSTMEAEIAAVNRR